MRLFGYGWYGGAWPFIVGDLNCQVNFANVRDHYDYIKKKVIFLLVVSTRLEKMLEACGYNRSVMPLDGTDGTYATLMQTTGSLV